VEAVSTLTPIPEATKLSGWIARAGKNPEPLKVIWVDLSIPVPRPTGHTSAKWVGNTPITSWEEGADLIETHSWDHHRPTRRTQNGQTPQPTPDATPAGYLKRLTRKRGDRNDRGASSAPRGGVPAPKTDHRDLLTEYAEGLAIWSVKEYDFKPDSASDDEIHEHLGETLARRFHGLPERALLLQSYPEQDMALVFAQYKIPIYVLMTPTTPPFLVEVTV
jgi:hypothetical protein